MKYNENLGQLEELSMVRYLAEDILESTEHISETDAWKIASKIRYNYLYSRAFIIDDYDRPPSALEKIAMNIESLSASIEQIAYSIDR